MFRKKLSRRFRQWNTPSDASMLSTDTDRTDITARTNFTALTTSTRGTSYTTDTNPAEIGGIGRANITDSQADSVDVYREKVKSEDLRDLRELIRRRYALDVEIWEKKDIIYGSRPKVKELMDKSDAMLKQIEDIVRKLDSRDCFESDIEYKKALKIK